MEAQLTQPGFPRERPLQATPCVVCPQCGRVTGIVTYRGLGLPQAHSGLGVAPSEGRDARVLEAWELPALVSVRGDAHGESWWRVGRGGTTARVPWCEVAVGSRSAGVDESPLMTWGEVENTPLRVEGSETPYVDRTPGPAFKVGCAEVTRAGPSGCMTF